MSKLEGPVELKSSIQFMKYSVWSEQQLNETGVDVGNNNMITFSCEMK